METWHRFEVEGKIILFLIYSSAVRVNDPDLKPWREYRYAIFEGWKPHGGGIFSE